MERRTIFTPQRYVPGSNRNDEYMEKCLKDGIDPPGLTVKKIDENIGKGVFAEKKYPMGSFIVEYHGELITKEQGLKRERSYPIDLGSYLLYFKSGRTQMCVDATFSTRCGRYVNDGTGEEKNSELKLVKLKGKLHVVLVASRNIRMSEEIRYDYGVDNLPWRLKYRTHGDQKKTCLADEIKKCTVLLRKLDPGVFTSVCKRRDGSSTNIIKCKTTRSEIYGTPPQYESNEEDEIIPIDIDDVTDEIYSESKKRKVANAGSSLTCEPNSEIDIQQIVGHEASEADNFTLVRDPINESEDTIVLRVCKTRKEADVMCLPTITAPTGAPGPVIEVNMQAIQQEASNEMPVADDPNIRESIDVTNVILTGNKQNMESDLPSETTASKDINQLTLNGRKKKGSKPYRPCPFCGKFKSKLKEHLKLIHKDQNEVKHAISLPPSQQQIAFENLRKMGIYKENVKRIREQGSTDNVELIRERSQGNDTLVTCLACKGFVSKKQFYRHRKICSSSSFLDPPRSINPTFLTSMQRNKYYTTYQVEVLDRFRQDDVGDFCRVNEYIVAFGFHRYLSIGMRKRKKDEKRKSLMNTMRHIAKLYMDFKTIKTVETTCILDMFLKENKEYFKETIYQRKNSSSADSNLTDGYTVKTFAKFLRDMLSDEGDDDRHSQMSKFLDTLSYNWRELFGDSEGEILVKRSEKRKPVNLPPTEELIRLRTYTVDTLRFLTDDTYNFIAEKEFTLLRDLLVSRLTLFNARRGGEPSRLTLDEWYDAEKGVWLERFRTTELEYQTEHNLLKIAYQVGKSDKTLVPVMFTPDCIGGIRKLCDPVIRKDAGVNPKNVYLFPRTRLSLFHTIGTTSIDSTCNRAGVKSVTATKVRHWAATLHAEQDVSESERQAFFSHMGHSNVINRDVYQCPPAVLEVTKVGRFLQHLDAGLNPDHQSNSGYSMSKNSSSHEAPEHEETSIGRCDVSSASPDPKAPEHEETSIGRCDVSSASPDPKGFDHGHASTSGNAMSRVSPSLRGFLYTVADTLSVHRVLNGQEELIDEHEIETKPEDVSHISYDQYVLDAAKPLFTTDGWLLVEDLLAHAKAFVEPSRRLYNKKEAATCSQKAENSIGGEKRKVLSERKETESDSTICNDENISKDDPSDQDTMLQVTDMHGFEDRSAWNEGTRFGTNNTSEHNGDDVNIKEKSKERQYIRWSKEDTKLINQYFAKYVYDVSRFDKKGVLPGYTEIRRFLKTYPNFLAQLTTEQKLKTIHVKLYNERNKSRHIAERKLNNKA